MGLIYLSIQVSPCDGKVLTCGVVDSSRHIEQVKGVTYQLDKFLGSSSPKESYHNPQTCLHHIIIYLAPGDYHHFHSPTDWTVQTRRHFPGVLPTFDCYNIHVMYLTIHFVCQLYYSSFERVIARCIFFLFESFMRELSDSSYLPSTH